MSDPHRAGLYHWGGALQPEGAETEPNLRVMCLRKFGFKSVGTTAYHVTLLDYNRCVVHSIEIWYLPVVVAVEDHNIRLFPGFQRARFPSKARL